MEEKKFSVLHATSRCMCGRVTLGFAAQPESVSPVLHLECACCDCRQGFVLTLLLGYVISAFLLAHEFESTRGGPLSTSILSKIYYFSNDVLPPTDLSNLERTQLRSNARCSYPHSSYDKSTVQVHSGCYEMLSLHPSRRSPFVQW